MVAFGDLTNQTNLHGTCSSNKMAAINCQSLNIPAGRFYILKINMKLIELAYQGHKVAVRYETSSLYFYPVSVRRMVSDERLFVWKTRGETQALVG